MDFGERGIMSHSKINKKGCSLYIEKFDKRYAEAVTQELDRYYPWILAFSVKNVFDRRRGYRRFHS